MAKTIFNAIASEADVTCFMCQIDATYTILIIFGHEENIWGLKFKLYATPSQNAYHIAKSSEAIASIQHMLSSYGPDHLVSL